MFNMDLLSFILLLFQDLITLNEIDWFKIAYLRAFSYFLSKLSLFKIERT